MTLISEELEPVTRSTDIAIKQLHEHKQQLRIINSIVVREERAVGQEVARIQASSWTALGGNQQKLRRLKERQMELQNLGEYHKRTLAHVGGTLRKLRTKRADTINLRERALSASQHIPVQIHVKSLMTGLERLQQAQIDTREKKARTERILPFIRHPDQHPHSDVVIPALE